MAVAQPEYPRIAAELRRRISSGEYGPSDRLLTLPELCEAYRVSEKTIRDGLGLLRNEGLIESKAKARTRAAAAARPPHGR